MPNLTGEELSKLYPKTKTFDEIQAERDERRIRRTPKLVPLKVSLWTTLMIPTFYVVYYLIFNIILGGVGSTTGTLSSVSFSILLGLIGMVLLWYLFSLADGLAYRATTAAPFIRGLILIAPCLSAALFTALACTGLNEALAVTISMAACFIAMYATVSVVIRL